MNHVHLIGIGGTGLSAIALVLLERGVRVSGSDRQLSPLAKRVQAAGGQVFAGHRAENLAGADLVVRSSAVGDDNVEVQAARAAGIPVLKRSEFLERLLEGKVSLAVAGTHGKTTTTAMIAWVLTALGQDPSFIIGGVSSNLKTNAHAGQGPHFVIEADEYDRMFLGLRPQIAVVTNIEHDHPDCYPTPEDFYAAFRQYAANLLPGGTLIACADDPGAARLAEELSAQGRQVVSYGIGPADVKAEQVRSNAGGGFDFEVKFKGGPHKVSLQVPGLHNVRNALAALAAVDALGLDLEAAGGALGDFSGTGRRFELRGEAGGVTVIDDYGHHPTEIRATLAAARARYPGRRLWAVWQPHTYSRTRTLLTAFAAAFADADRVVTTEIYAAREPVPEDGFSGRDIAARIERPPVHFAPSLSAARDYLQDHLQPGDVVLVLSAGDADRLSVDVLEDLTTKERRVIKAHKD